MAQNYTTWNESLITREIVGFPRIDEFYGSLMGRFHMVLESFILSQRFTLFINALPRKKTTLINRFENVPLVYAGIPTQRELLEGVDSPPNTALDRYWNFLDVTALDSDTAVVSSQLYRSFSLGSYGLEDIERIGTGQLSEYFSAILSPESAARQPTPRQIAEYYILREYFDLATARYISVPLIMFGEFDGVIHLVYGGDEPAVNLKSRAIKNIIKSCSQVYENLVLEWDLVSRNPEKSEAIQLSMSEMFYEQVNRNPILKELGFKEYYQKYLGYFKKRIHLNDQVIHSKVYSPYLRAAIISIMIDSYAHNISAHSLVALNWWFKRRADNLRSGTEAHRQEVEELNDMVAEYMPEGFDRDRLLDLVQPWVEGLLVKDTSDEYDLVRYPGSLDREIQPLLKFLMQKGAFWSGIARDNHFGGEARTFFSVLWEDFINNPLYLGTIAKSEDIHKISLCIIQYADTDAEPLQKRTCRRPKIERDGGIFVEIDIKTQRPDARRSDNGEYYLEMPDGQQLSFAEHKELEDMSNFVYPGKDYAKAKEILQTCELFFPGEVVGRHAFFTMLENEIRNVKHYKGTDLARIQKEGLQLNVSIQPAHVSANTKGEKELYRIGVWIGTPTNLKLKSETPLILKKHDALTSDVMDSETFAPRLGGSFQDKICAGMLFNGKFDKVQHGDGNPARNLVNDTDRDSTYYPWVVSATSPADDVHADVEVCKSMNENREEFIKKYDHDRGYFKKYFFIWKSANVKYIDDATSSSFAWENIARFRFICIPPGTGRTQDIWQHIRANGVIRIIKEGQDSASNNGSGPKTVPAIHHWQSWLKTWLPHPSYALRIRIDGLPTSVLAFSKAGAGHFRYFNTSELAEFNEAAYDCVEDINIAHGGFSLDPEVLRYRTHGIYKAYFLRDVHSDQPVHDEATVRLAEMLEVMATHIAIFDNRIRLRIRNHEREDIFRTALKIDIFGEHSAYDDQQGEWMGEWEAQKQTVLPTCNFLILHLSYIEKILLTKYSDHKDFADENIGLFIEQEILPTVAPLGRVRENFILVITSGRGRTKWWSRLKEDKKYESYTHFTIFRPVESLISAIEDALARKDDIELKHNLVKVLFGS